MKIILGGSTGFVATELIKQALSNPAVTTIVGLARRETPVPENLAPGADSSKLKSVICNDFENYDESVKKQLAGADACIWLIGVTPSQLKTMTPAESRKICYNYAVYALETISKLPREGSMGKPFRFIYVSGAKSERDQTKKPFPLGEYLLMRGEVENYVLNHAKESNTTVDVCIAKPGLIDAPGRMGIVMKVVSTIGRTIIGLPKVDVSEISATLLAQAVGPIEKDTLLNEDLIRIGGKALSS